MNIILGVYTMMEVHCCLLVLLYWNRIMLQCHCIVMKFLYEPIGILSKYFADFLVFCYYIILYSHSILFYIIGQEHRTSQIPSMLEHLAKTSQTAKQP